MISRIIHNRTLRLFAVPSLLLPLGACSNMFAPQEDPRMAQLATGMQQCLDSQAQTSEQLQQQAQQMQQQQLALDALGEAMSVREIAQPEQIAVSVVNPVVACAEAVAAPSHAKIMVGQLEEVWLANLQLALPARIDTGAETSSLDARNIEIFERDGRRWVRFSIQHPVTGEPLPMERRLKRMVSIIQSNDPEAERRPVIKLDITVGPISQTAEFTLSDRSHLDYQVLVGRNILQDVMVVDVSSKHIAPYQLPDGEGGTP